MNYKKQNFATHVFIILKNGPYVVMKLGIIVIWGTFEIRSFDEDTIKVILGGFEKPRTSDLDHTKVSNSRLPPPLSFGRFDLQSDSHKILLKESGRIM